MMTLLFAVLSILALPFSLLSLDELMRLSAPVHEFCLSSLSDTAHFTISSALVCGENLTDPRLHLLFIQAGLYHVVVVSGAHLVTIELVLRRVLPVRFQTLIPIGLGFYCLMSGWQPPVVRAWFHSLLRLNGAASRTALLGSWLLCLALHPQWIHSLSLQLSVLASLALVRRHKSPLLFCLQIFILMLPLLMGWSPLHPGVVVAAFFLAPISVGLWSMTSLLEFVKPEGFDVWNGLLHFWEQVLAEVAHWQAPLDRFSLETREWAWAYLLFAFLLIHSLETTRLRQKQRALV